MEKAVNTSLSILKMNHIVFDRLSFSRIGFPKKSEPAKEINFKMGVSIHKTNIGEYTVSLIVSAEKESEYTAEVQVTGYVEIDDTADNKEILLKKNAVAILFPYVRSEFSLITAQPETEPIILPVLNIDSLIDRMDISIIDDTASKNDD